MEDKLFVLDTDVTDEVVVEDGKENPVAEDTVNTGATVVANDTPKTLRREINDFHRN